ncbi:MAG: hypothetical protein HKN57_03030 [Xanthomonadales bacterium]|nr:hypothetical protein [Gammaproteobacteria bacterium]NND56200.1 hypothetical protein [Xanthomonadales bacterium]
MPESIDRELEHLLEYSDPPDPEAFTLSVTRSLRNKQRTRRLILWTFGLSGALFGLAGAVLLSGSIARLMTFTLDLPVMETMQALLIIVGAAAFYLWFMNDDFSLDN